MSQAAKDPYLGLNEHIKGLTRGQMPAGCVPGCVLSSVPLRIRAEGMDLDKDDLRVSWHLTDAWAEQMLTAMGVTPPFSLTPALRPGDTVLLLPSADRQTYFIIDKVMEVTT